MRVEPSQLVPGCVLLKDINGKTSRPIIPQNTVLTEEHILLVEKFLIETVDVSSKLAAGEIFKPEVVHKEENHTVNQSTEQSMESFENHYNWVVEQYKRIFTNWQNSMVVSMPEIRNLLIPLLKRIDEVNAEVYLPHHHVSKPDYNFHHSVSMGVLSALLAKRMGYKKGEWLQIGLAGFLSDCGMAKIGAAIIRKSGSLTYSEQKEMRRHPEYSYRFVEKVPTVTQAVKLAILQHHERMDGTGYPFGITKDKIHMYARIITVCDSYHAMTCERLYKDGQSPFNVMEALQEDQYSKLDHNVVQTFINDVTTSFMGMKVKLSTNQVGEIVFIEARYPTRPMVRMDDTGEIIALKNESSLYISEILRGNVT